MPAQQLYDLMDYMKTTGITFCYCGYMTEQILVSMGDAIKKSLVMDEADRKTSKNVFSIFVEQVQNVIRYSAQKGSVNAETEARYGVLTMGKADEKIFLGCGNMIENKDIDRLKDRVEAECIDVGTAPENYLGKIAKLDPETVLFVDAAYVGRKPGKYKVLRGKELLRTGFTTHDISPKMLMDYLAEETKASIFLLGVQPERISLGDEMSTPVKEALNEITRLIKEAKNA